MEADAGLEWRDAKRKKRMRDASERDEKRTRADEGYG